ncbi:MAG: type II toxin-antitoxin system Phd/YefM family antitoxin [bacterium]|nr:type II toxin-antitoxin system Phd/YefM family antitoxin [Candidatus Colousia faecequi]
MVVVSSREFRANQKKYFDLAQSNLVVIKSRNHGSYKLIPVDDSDFIMNETELLAKINRGIVEYEQGKAIAMSAGETSEDYLARLLSE